MKKCILIVIVFLANINSFCQQKTGAIQGKDGVYIFLNEDAIGANFKNSKYDFVKIGEELSEYLQSMKTIVNK